MGASTGIVLTATAISFTNEWWHTNKPNFKIVMAGLAVTLFFDGIEHINVKAATGLATIMLVSVLLTPIDGDSPFQTVDSLVNPKAAKPKPSSGGSGGAGIDKVL